MNNSTHKNFGTVRNLSMNTYKAVLVEGALDQRSHSYFFYLINPEGEIVKKYNGMSDIENDMLIDDVKTVSGS